MQFNIGKSGGVSYKWDFGDGSPTVTTTEPTVSHTYDSAGDKTATLTVHLRRRRHGQQDRDAAEDVPTPLFTNVNRGSRRRRAAGARADARLAGELRAFIPSVDA